MTSQTTTLGQRLLIVLLFVSSIFVCFLFWISSLLDLKMHLSLFLVPLIFVPAISFVILWIAGIIYSLFCKKWRLACIIAAVPITVAAFFSAGSRLGFTAHYFDFLNQRDRFIAQVAEVSKEGQQTILAWDWGDTGGPGATPAICTLVYDSSDIIARPRAFWPPGWILQADRAARGNSLYSVLHPDGFSRDPKYWPKDVVEAFGQHFYLVREIW